MGVTGFAEKNVEVMISQRAANERRAVALMERKFSAVAPSLDAQNAADISPARRG